MVGEATARLVENAVLLGVPEMVHIKGVALPVRAQARWPSAIISPVVAASRPVWAGLGAQHRHRDLAGGRRGTG